MPDFAAQRVNMVEGQVRANDVTDLRIQGAMTDIQRESFVPAHLDSVAYMDSCLEVADGRYILDPRCFAKLAQLASVGAEDHVLDVGCASGYSAAILARLAKDVIALEDDAALIGLAAQNLEDIKNVQTVQGQLSDGYQKAAPYDLIFVNGALETRPEGLLGQLKDGGRLVAVIRSDGRGQAHLFVNNGGLISERAGFDAQVPILRGFEKTKGFVF